MNGVSLVLTWAIDAVLLAASAVIVLRTGALSGALGRNGVRNILRLYPLRVDHPVDCGDEHRLDRPCRRASYGRNNHSARGNRVGALGALIRIG